MYSLIYLTNTYGAQVGCQALGHHSEQDRLRVPGPQGARGLSLLCPDSEMCSFADDSTCSEMPITEPHLGLFKFKPRFDRELIGT